MGTVTTAGSLFKAVAGHYNFCHNNCPIVNIFATENVMFYMNVGLGVCAALLVTCLSV